MNQFDNEEARLADQGLVLVDGDHPQATKLGLLARQLLTELPRALHDDRYMGAISEEMTAAAIAQEADGELKPVAFIGGTQSRDRLQLDALTRTTTEDSDNEVMALAIRVLAQRVAMKIGEKLGDELPGGEDRSPTLELWTRPDVPHLASAPASLGMDRYRSLHQMRGPLPVAAEASSTRPFDPDRDLLNLVEVNNRAFADHPDQSRQTSDDMSALISQPWFENEGLRILDDPDGSGRMAGFCWTKVHPGGHYHPVLAPETANDGKGMGEIFVIGLDPDFHGRGMGTPLVAAGLNWLGSRGLQEVLLYVEADNHPALKTYERLGFVHNRTDTAWRSTS